jgi:putative membrane protein
MRIPYLIGMSVVTCALLWLSTIGARFPQDQLILHIPTVIALIILLALAWKGCVGHVSFTMAILFWWIHIVGARYSYCEVPYNQWCIDCFGISLHEVAGFQRNHFDRLVHFLYGLLFTPMLVDLARRWISVNNVVIHLLSFVTISATSGYYEIFEWLLTLTDRPDRAERYVGMQGDPWDAQKDMALALVGALLASGIMNFRLRKESVA